MRRKKIFYLFIYVFFTIGFSFRTESIDTQFRKISLIIDGLEYVYSYNYESDYDRSYDRSTELYIKIKRLNVIAGPTDIDYKSAKKVRADLDGSGYQANATGVEFGFIENGKKVDLGLGSGSIRITDLEFMAQDNRNPSIKEDNLIISKAKGQFSFSNFNFEMNNKGIRALGREAENYFELLSSFLMRSLRFDFNYDRSKGPVVLKLSSQSDFANIDISGNLNYISGDINRSTINKIVIRMTRLSQSAESMLRDFERESGAEFIRVNNGILVEISGDPKNPEFKGIIPPKERE